jgi:hypothetical protein
MRKSYQVVQERYEPGYDDPTQDYYPILFASIDEARARVKRDGLGFMFTQDGNNHYIVELDGVSYTGKTFAA